MTRKGYNKTDVNVMMKIFRRLFITSSDDNFNKRLIELKKDYSNIPVANEFFDFVDAASNSKMSLCRGRDFE